MSIFNLDHGGVCMNTMVLSHESCNAHLHASQRLSMVIY